MRGPRPILQFVLMAAACLMAAWVGPVNAATTQVQLTVVERAGARRTNEPVTTGVPLPKGALADVKNVRLLLDGKEVPAQFRVAGRWLPDTSIKWLLVDLQATLDHNEMKTYTLEYGPGVTATAKPAAAVAIDETDDAYTVTTGAATFRLSKKTFTLFDEVMLGKKQIVKNTAPAAHLRKLRKWSPSSAPTRRNSRTTR